MIANQILQLKENLDNSRRAVSFMGGTVGETPAFDNLAAEIDSIPVGNANYVMVADEETVYRKNILPGAMPKAKLMSVGGMTYKCKNLIPFPYASTSNTNNGITWTVNADGTVTANGTATASSEFSIIENTILNATTNYGAAYMSGCPAGGSAETYYISCIHTGHKDTGNGVSFGYFNGSFMRFSIVIKSGYTAQNLVFKPMLNLGTTALPYEPYYEGLRDTKVTAIRNHGANILNTMADLSVPDNTASSNTTPRKFTPNTIVQGIAGNNYYSPVDGKGEILSRTENSCTFANKSGYGIGFVFKLEPNTIYTVSCNSTAEQQTINCAHYDDQGNFLQRTGIAGKTLTFTTDQYANVVIVFIDSAAGTSDVLFETTISNIMLTQGSVALSYVPYHAPIDISLPDEIVSLGGWGKGIEGYANTYDFENGAYTQRCVTYTFTGDENYPWIFAENSNGYYRYYIRNSQHNIFPNFIRDKGISNLYTIGNWDNRSAGAAGSFYTGTDGTIIFIVDATIHAEGWTNYLKRLAAAGTPLIITVAPTEPITEKIPVAFDNILNIEGGGSIEFINEYKQPTPSNIRYMRRVV